MRKHHGKHNGKTHRRLKNANVRVISSTSIRVKSLLDEIDPQGSFAVSYLQEQFLSKLNEEGDCPASVRRSSAVRKWEETERRNALTNARLRGMDRGYNILPRVTFYRFLGFAQRIIGEILGPLENSVVLGSMSGGASTSRKRTMSHPAQKFAGEVDVTSAAVPFLDVIHQESELLRQYNTFSFYREVEGAVLFTVPKKSDIDRCACKEPDVNMFLQKGVGRHIRRRLLKFGINLNDQSINRRYAHAASLDGSLATLDLSSASDSVTLSCVQALLPTDWFLYLNDIRSQVVDVDGTYVRTEMFSSMGNGFTFELESLIFYALMRTTAYFEGFQGVISVYGDDLIIPSGMYDSASWILSEFGFSLNPEKSFHTGPFRESCGGHYLLGEDVTPFYLKRPVTHLTDVIRVANQLRLWAMADPCRRYEFPWVFSLWESLRDLVPKDLWGGRDYAVDTQLVTPDGPTNRLVRLAGPLKVPEVGRYLAWHVTNWNRADQGKDAFDPLEATKICRKRRATPGAPTYTDMFLEEHVGYAGRG